MRFHLRALIFAFPFALWADFDWSCSPPAEAPDGWSLFSPSERERLFPAPQWKPDFRGIDKSRLRPAPAPGVHPRIYIAPGDVPEIRNRIRNSKAAALAYERLCEATEGFFHEGDIVDVEEAQVITEKPKFDLMKGEAAGAADPLALDEKPTRTLKKTPIQRLVDGLATPDEYDNAEKSEGLRLSIVPALAMNALRALIDDDPRRGKRVATALATYGRICQVRMAAGKSIGAYRPLHALAQAYDYAHAFMSDAQRDDVRKAIVKSLTDPVRFLDGAMYGVGHPRPSHNWVSLVTQHILILSLAIEGEQGYNPQTTAAMAQTSERWVHYWWGAKGCSNEGMGKCQLNATCFLSLARRGNWLICHPHVRRAIDSFYPSIMQPWGYTVTTHSGWGGSGNPLRLGDILPMKFIAPDDPVVDFVYRNAVGDDYERIGPMDVILAVDWTGPRNWRQHAREANVPVNYLDPGRAMLCARDRWDPEGMWLQFLCDQQWTAHMQMEIGNFMLTSHGRPWAHFIHANDSVGASSYHSVLLIDGIQQGGLGRMTAQRANAHACFATADWAPVYNHYVTGPEEKPTVNDYRPLSPVAAPFGGWRGEFDWRNGWLKREPPVDWKARPVLELDYAHRTIGMVRGPNPYVLILDDVQPKDGLTHYFAWYMQVPNDVVVASMVNHQVNEFAFLDILLAAEADSPVSTDTLFTNFGHRSVRKGSPCLLVRVLKIRTDPGRHSPVPGVLEAYNNVPHWPNTSLKPVGKRLKIETWAKSPGYRVLLYPHRHGEELPKTQWEEKGKRLRVIFKHQMDVFDFDYTPGDQPRFVLQHNEVAKGVESTLKFGMNVDAMEEALEGLDDAPAPLPGLQ